MTALVWHYQSAACWPLALCGAHATANTPDVGQVTCPPCLQQLAERALDYPEERR